MNRMNELELKELNRVIGILTAYSEGETIEYLTDRNGWVHLHAIPCVTVYNIDRYRIISQNK